MDRRARGRSAAATTPMPAHRRPPIAWAAPASAANSAATGLHTAVRTESAPASSRATSLERQRRPHRGCQPEGEGQPARVEAGGRGGAEPERSEPGRRAPASVGQSLEQRCRGARGERRSELRSEGRMQRPGTAGCRGGRGDPRTTSRPRSRTPRPRTAWRGEDGRARSPLGGEVMHVDGRQPRREQGRSGPPRGSRGSHKSAIRSAASRLVEPRPVACVLHQLEGLEAGPAALGGEPRIGDTPHGERRDSAGACRDRAPRSAPGVAHRCRRSVARWVPWSNCSHTARTRSSGQASADLRWRHAGSAPAGNG